MTIRPSYTLTHISTPHQLARGAAGRQPRRVRGPFKGYWCQRIPSDARVSRSIVHIGRSNSLVSSRSCMWPVDSVSYDKGSCNLCICHSPIFLTAQQTRASRLIPLASGLREINAPKRSTCVSGFPRSRQPITIAEAPAVRLCAWVVPLSIASIAPGWTLFGSDDQIFDQSTAVVGVKYA